MTVRRRIAGDEGTTLLELMVGMTVMAIFMTMFTVAVVNLFSTTNKTQAVVNSSTQLNLAFERLDTQVRYASLIDAPVVSPPVASPTWSIAFQTDGPMTTTCNKLAIIPTGSLLNNVMVNNLVEYTRTANVDADGTLPPMPPWGTSTALATGVTLTAVDKDGVLVDPFVPLTAPQQVHQALRLHLAAVDGNGKSLTNSFSEVTFSALNSGTSSKPRLSKSVGAPVCGAP